MKKYIFIVLASFGFLTLYPAYTLAKLSTSEKSEIIEAILSGDYSALDRINLNPDEEPETSVPAEADTEKLLCVPGCHATGSNPYAESACAAQFTPQGCMSLYDRIGCLWSCR